MKNKVFSMGLIIKLIPIYIYMIAGVLTPLSADNNIALEASYTFKPAAEYELTQNANDKTDLTDGIYVKNRMWLSKKTVGWKKAGLIEIEIDLGSNYAISGLCFNSARDEKAEVSFPARVDVFVSDDKQNYLRVGDVYEGKKPDNGPYLVKKFCMNEIFSYGRYVLLVVVPAGRVKYTFLDEIEVYGRTGKNKLTESALYKREEIAGYIVNNNQWQNKKLIMKKKLKALEMNASYEIKVRIDNLIAGIDSVINPDNEQVEKYQDDLSAIVRKKNTNTLEEGIYIWKKSPWGSFDSLLPPELAQDDISFNLEVLDGIGASDAFIITNYLDVTLTYEITMDWFVAKAPDLKISKVVNVITSEYQEVGDALVPYQGESITIKPGESKQIWLTVSNQEGSYGSFVGSLGLKSSASPVYDRQIPIEVKAFPAKPVQQEIYVNAWAYLNIPLITNEPKMAAQDLAQHHVNVSVLHPVHVPWPAFFSKDGSFTANYMASDRDFAYQKNARKRLLFLNFNNMGLRSFNNQYEFMSENWQNIFTKWIEDWVDHLKMQGLNYDDFAFYPVDEPKNDEEIDILLRTAELIKKIDSKIEVYTTLGSMGSRDVIAARNLIDVYQVKVDDLSDLKITTLKKLNKKIWTYSTISGKNVSPLKYYRSQAWKAFQAGATGIGFWAYADIGWGGGSAWDDFDGRRPDYAVIYEAKNYIVGSKRWEAWKAGVEDHRLLTMYKQIVSQEKIVSLVNWVLDGNEFENRYDIARAKMIKSLALSWKSRNLKLKQDG